mgnify:CR=1 FL=1|jgi:NUDIX domain family protein
MSSYRLSRAENQAVLDYLAELALSQDTYPLFLNKLYLNNIALGYLTSFVKELIKKQESLLWIENSGDLRLRYHCWQELSVNLASFAQSLMSQGVYTCQQFEYLDVIDCHGQVYGQLPYAIFRPLGLLSQTVRINAYQVRNGLVYHHLAQRSENKHVYPGFWDNLVAGKVQAGETSLQALKRESWEEAGLIIDEKNTGFLNQYYQFRSLSVGVLREYLSIYVLAIPANFIPCNQDGEVVHFTQLSTAEIIKLIISEKMMPDAALSWLIFVSKSNFIHSNEKVQHQLNRMLPSAIF